jgi:elongation factor G
MLRHLRNFGIVAHVDAGKTSTTEQVLYLSGAKHRAGAVDDGTATTDFMDQEQQRGITIQAAAVTCRWQTDGIAAELNLIDTPGHIDFTAEVIRSMRVLDGAVVVLCGRHGVQANTPRVWKYADRYQVPRLVFVNKMDSVGADFARTVEQIRTVLKASPAVIQLPIFEQGEFCGIVDVIERQALVWVDEDGRDFTVQSVPETMRAEVERCRRDLVEQLADQDASLLERYLDGQDITADEARSALRQATIARKLFPVLAGSAHKKRGIQPLLDAVVRYLPGPDEVPPVVGKTDGTEVTRRCDPGEPLCALAFKVMEDPHGDLTFVRVYSGALRPGASVWNPRTGGERVARTIRVQGSTRTDVDELLAGDIGAVVGFKDVLTGDTLCSRDHPIVLESITFPEPVLSLAIEPVQRRDLQRLVKGLRHLSRGDPSFRFRVDEEAAGQILIAGLGELHLEVKRELLREAGIQTRASKPEVSYRETIQRRARHRHTLKMQNGGRGLFAEIEFDVWPLPPGDGFVFEQTVVGGAIPANFIRAVETGMREALCNGPLGGYPVVDVGVGLRDGRTHEKDSSELAFKLAAGRALPEALAKAGPVLLEPIMVLEVEVPAESVGGVIGDVLQRRGRITGQTATAESVVLQARMPLAETFGRQGRPGFTTSLRNASQGKGQFTLTPLCYERAYFAEEGAA